MVYAEAYKGKDWTKLGCQMSDGKVLGRNIFLRTAA